MAAKIKRSFENGTPFMERRVRGDDSKFENRTDVRRIWRIPDVGVLILAVAILCTGCHGYKEQRFAMEPQDQVAVEGSRVTLPCRIENKVGLVQWTKDGFGLGAHRNLSGYDRYTMIGSDEEGDFSLEINRVILEDSGGFQCQVSAGFNGETGICSRKAILNVLVVPDPPTIVQGDFIDATEDQPVDIECVSHGGKPAAEITWVDGRLAMIKKDINCKIFLLTDKQRFQTRCVLRLTPTKEYHNQTITCQAQNTVDRTYQVATVHIEVKYAPKLEVSVKSGMVNGKIPEGSEARFLCEVDANPPPQVYRWYLNNNPVIGDYINEMIIFNVTRKHNKAVVKCEVSNSVGTRDKTVTLDVTYAPVFRTRPQNIAAEVGKRVTLSCDVDGHPQPEIRWLFHEPGRIGQVKGKAPNLNVYVGAETAGRYICKASVDGYPEIESEATIFIKGVPNIISNTTQYGTEGDGVTIECVAHCVPKPDDIRWYFEGHEISVIQDPDYAIQEETIDDGMVKSSLSIRNSQLKHYGLYNCSITNEYGNANVAILLIEIIPLSLIFTGITAGIVVSFIFIIILVIYYRRKRKNSQQMSDKPDVTVTTGDMYKGSDRSSNISDLKMQPPQGDGSYELDYTSSDRSDTKITAGLPLAGPVQLPSIRHDDPLMQFRYSNDYSDPAYGDPYIKGPVGYVYDYPQGYLPPSNLRIQLPAELEVHANNRSSQGSLTRSIDTASTLPMSAGHGSQNNSLQRTTKSPEETDAINNLGLPLDGDTSPTPIYAQPKNKTGVDRRYSATYGNPYLRNSSLLYGSQVNTAKPSATPAPPPYSAVRSSVVISSGNGNQPSQATHV
ncbi:irregular chiasm C-roughest protein isoform 2-T2 [Aphomia sociella]